MSVIDQFPLIGGPHDGHVIVDEINKIPQTIYTMGKQSKGDPDWRRVRTSDFRYMYVLDGSKFKFKEELSVF